MKWNLFVACGLLVGYTMYAMGAPLAAVAGGIAIAGVVNAGKKRGLRSL
jgi:hypothetical protein